MGSAQLHLYIVKWTENFSRPPNRTSQATVVACRSDCEQSDTSLWTSGAFHLMSKNELTFGEKDTIRRSKQPTVNKTANGKAESTEEATLYVNDLDIFVTMMLLEDSPTVLSLRFILQRKELLSRMERGTITIIDERWTSDMVRVWERCANCGSFKEPRMPEDLSKASGDRLQIPGASASGDWSREVLQSDVFPGQSSGDRLRLVPE